MFLHNKNFRIASLVFVLLAFGFFYPGLANAGVVETSMDFGEVEVGLTATSVLHITNLSDYSGLSAEISLGPCSCGTPFSIGPEKLQTIDIYIEPKGTANVDVYFTPSSPGDCSTILYVFYGRFNWEEIEVTGTGFAITTKQTTVVELVDFFNNSVEAKTLIGLGPGNSADNRLRALGNMISVATDLIKNEELIDACEKLSSIYKKIDGLDKPQDFVGGDAIYDLREMVLKIMEGIGCK